jgi:hypothetical protein
MTESVLQFVELDHAEPSHGPLFDGWQAGKTKMERATLCPTFPSVLLLATSNGYLQMVDSSSGSFRLFAILVADIPCEVGPRCLTIDAAGSTIGRGGQPIGLCAVFALAYSSTVCRVDLDTGRVTELVSFESRPSAVCAERDHVAAGDGRGDVCLWRSSEPRVSLCWRRKNIAARNNDISCIHIAHDAVFVGCGDFTVKVLALRDGALTASLLSEGYAPIAAIASFTPFTDDVAVASSKGLITVWRPDASRTPSNTNATEATRVVPSSALLSAEWTVRNVLSAFPVATLTYRNGYLVAGGVDGRLALFSTTTSPSADGNSSSTTGMQRSRGGSSAPMPMLVCYDLEHTILCGHVTDDSSLVAVTKSGDVWRWPLSEVLAAPDDDAIDDPDAQARTDANDDINASARRALEHAEARGGLADSSHHSISRSRQDFDAGATMPSSEAAGSHGLLSSTDAPGHALSSTARGSDRVPASRGGALYDDGARYRDDDADSLSGETDEDGARDTADATANSSARPAEEVIEVFMGLETPPDGCLTEVTASSSRRPPVPMARPSASNAADVSVAPEPRSWTSVPAAVPSPVRQQQSAAAAGTARARWPDSEMPSSVMINMTRGGDDHTTITSVPSERAGETQRPTAASAAASSPSARLRGTADEAHIVDSNHTVPESRSLVERPSRSVDPVSVDGLLRGRRMDPRAARQAAERAERAGASGSTAHALAAPHADGASRFYEEELARLQLVPADPNRSRDGELSDDAFSRALREVDSNQERVVGVSDKTVDDFMKQHQATTAALAFANPIRPYMNFGKDDVVFTAVGLTGPAQPRICEGADEEPYGRSSMPMLLRRDDLAPATAELPIARRKDPKYEREKRAEGPIITEHLCHDLLAPLTGPAIFFDVYHTELPPLEPHMLPLPMPPAPILC